MKRRDIPEAVLSKIAKFEKQAAYLTRKVTQRREAITATRDRLTGGFVEDSECYDLRATLDRLVDDLSVSESDEEAAKDTLSECKHFLNELPDNAGLELVQARSTNGLTLDGVRQHITAAEKELEALRAVPVPGADTRKRVEQYVASLGQPKVLGIGSDRLEIIWPNNTAALLALLLPDKMVEVLMQEITRQANTPMPIEQRTRRMAELRVCPETSGRIAEFSEHEAD